MESEWLMKKYSTFRTLYLKLVSSVAEHANITRQIHLTFEVVGLAYQNIAGNHHILIQNKISFSYIQIQESLWRKLKNLKPLFSRNKKR